MGNTFNKEIVRSITQSAGRFAAIAVISLLGAGFFAGLRMTSPDMTLAGDEFFDATGLYDISVASTLGFGDDEVAVLRSLDGVAAAMPSHEADVLVSAGDSNVVAKVHGLDVRAAQASDTSDGVHAVTDDPSYLNRPVLLDGRWPRVSGECVVDVRAAEDLDVSVGDTLRFKDSTQDLAETFDVTEFRVVGLVNSPQYVSTTQLGETKLGSGSVELYLFVPEGDFSDDAPYTVVYLAVEGASALEWPSDDYERAVAAVRARVEETAPHLAASRLATVRGDAQATLDDARADYERERADAEAELDDAQIALDDALAQLEAGEAELAAGEESLVAAAQRLSAGESELASGEAASASGQAALDEQRRSADERFAAAEAELNDAQAALDERLAQLPGLNDALAQVDAAIAQIDSQLAALDAQIAVETDEGLLAALRAQRDAAAAQREALAVERRRLSEGIASIEQGAAALEAARAQLAEERASADARLDEAQAALDAARSRLAAARATLEAGRLQQADGAARLGTSRSQLSDGRADYERGAAELTDARSDAESRFADAEAELASAQADIDALEAPEVFVLDRDKNPGAASLKSDAEGIGKIASVFPLMFFLVAALVSLTSMTRMVEDERLLIGTFKALGYDRGRIVGKYLVYAVLASGVGSIVGVLVFSRFLPWFIMTAYSVSYAVPVYPTPLRPAVVAVALGLGIGITVVATWWAAASTLRERPAALLLPKAPKAGSRILLERATPLWRRLSFSHKVTARNLFRYKRRFFMAVAGIAGCTALLMVGFGLRDAIGDIVSTQYDDIVRYDLVVRVDDQDDAARDDLKAALAARTEAATAADSQVMVAHAADGEDVRIEVVVPYDPEAFASFVDLRERTGKAPLSLDGASLVVTEKAATELGLSAGGEVELYAVNEVGDATGAPVPFPFGGAAENYLSHYAYCSPAAYRAATGEDPALAVYYARLPQGFSDEEKKALSDELLAISGVTTVSFTEDAVATYQDMLDLMNSIIGVLVLAAAALAFVVLYNLTNINIAERVREIATLKVLGFMRGEVDAYIFREVLLLALIGAVLGCVLGVFLEGYIVVSAETPQMMFGRTIHAFSYAASFLLTLVFAAVVAVSMRGKLRSISMVESLKSIE